MSRRTAAVLATGALLSVVVSGAALAAPVKKACSLVRPSEVSGQFAAATVKKGPTPPGPPTATTCMWEIGTGTPAGGSVALFLQRGSEAKAGFALAKRQFADSATPVTELGRKAFEAGDVVWILKGSTLVYVQGLFYGDGKPVDLDDRLVALARLAYDRA